MNTFRFGRQVALAITLGMSTAPFVRADIQIGEPVDLSDPIGGVDDPTGTIDLGDPTGGVDVGDPTGSIEIGEPSSFGTGGHVGGDFPPEDFPPGYPHDYPPEDFPPDYPPIFPPEDYPPVFPPGDYPPEDYPPEDFPPVDFPQNPGNFDPPTHFPLQPHIPTPFNVPPHLPAPPRTHFPPFNGPFEPAHPQPFPQTPAHLPTNHVPPAHSQPSTVYTAPPVNHLPPTIQTSSTNGMIPRNTLPPHSTPPKGSTSNVPRNTLPPGCVGKNPSDPLGGCIGYPEPAPRLRLADATPKPPVDEFGRPIPFTPVPPQTLPTGMQTPVDPVPPPYFPPQSDKQEDPPVKPKLPWLVPSDNKRLNDLMTRPSVMSESAPLETITIEADVADDRRDLNSTITRLNSLLPNQRTIDNLLNQLPNPPYDAARKQAIRNAVNSGNTTALRTPMPDNSPAARTLNQITTAKGAIKNLQQKAATGTLTQQDIQRATDAMKPFTGNNPQSNDLANQLIGKVQGLNDSIRSDLSKPNSSSPRAQSPAAPRGNGMAGRGQPSAPSGRGTPSGGGGAGSGMARGGGGGGMPGGSGGGSASGGGGGMPSGGGGAPGGSGGGMPGGSGRMAGGGMPRGQGGSPAGNPFNGNGSAGSIPSTASVPNPRGIGSANGGFPATAQFPSGGAIPGQVMPPIGPRIPMLVGRPVVPPTASIPVMIPSTTQFPLSSANPSATQGAPTANPTASQISPPIGGSSNAAGAQGSSAASASAPNGSLQPISARATLLNADKSDSILYRVNGESFEMKPGFSHSLSDREFWVVEFDRGGSLGTARYKVKPGTYKFASTEKGWELVKLKAASTTGEQTALIP